MHERAKAVIAQLNAADADGLDPSDYAIPKLEANAGPEALADFELKLTSAVLESPPRRDRARPLVADRARHLLRRPAPEPADVLKKLASASDARAALDSYNPQHAAYKALKAKLAEVRGHKGGAAPSAMGRR